MSSAEANLEQARQLVGDDPLLAVEVDEALCDVFVAAGNADRVGEVGQRLLSRLNRVGAPPKRKARVHLWLARTAVISAAWVIAQRHLDHARELGRAGR